MAQAVAWARAYNNSSQINAFPILVVVVQKGLPQQLQRKAISRGYNMVRWQIGQAKCLVNF